MNHREMALCQLERELANVLRVLGRERKKLHGCLAPVLEKLMKDALVAIADERRREYFHRTRKEVIRNDENP